ncbi:MAG: autotransporter-associated beta strand repeat-containing protein, partial [Kiritimatiellae bacterium]|nr:autotransporter-associated beta strand repeat-containing protein [Kiritimatiellia bacterium]
AATRGGTALAAGVYTAADGWITGGGALYVNASRMEVEDGVLVFDVPGGRSETYATALAASITKVVKRGAGTATLSAATTAFTGQTVVEAGTLVITDRAALGANTPITVEKGGTFWLNIPHPDGNQGTAVFKGHTVTIAGDGADGCGAFRYSQTNSGNADGLLSRLVLSDDASIECAKRWGMNAENDVIELNGHTLTRFGGDNLCLYNTMRAGTFLNTAGTLTFQSTAKFPDGAGTTLVVTNAGKLSLWAQNAAHPVQAAVRLYTGRTVSIDSGAQNTFNGPFHVAKYGPPNGTVVEAYLETSTKNNNTAVTLNGPLTSDTGLDYDHHCRFVKTGGGTLWLNGPADLEGNVYASAGTFAMTSGATRVFRRGFSMRDGATVLLADGTLNLGFLRVANGGNVKSRFRQTGGTLQCTSDDAPRIGESANGQGYYTLEGGAAHFSNTVYVAEWANSFGAFRQKGGFFEMKRGGVMYVGCRGTGLFVQTGGTNDTLVTRGGQSDRFTMNWTNGVSEVTVSGTGTVFKTERFVMGSDRSLSTNIFNLSDGALFRANRFRPKENRKAGAMACVNVDGGTMQPTFAWGWNGIDPTGANFFKACPEHFVIWKKGLVFDTSCTGEATGGAGESMPPFHYESPTGQGVERVVLPQVAATNTAYMGIARIVFQGEGWGASAYADYDFDAHKLTHVVVTSRGCDWGAGTKAFVESPDRKALWECELTLTSNEGHAGELVKRGAYNLNLYATNTLTGGIAVEQGALNAHVAGAIPSNTPVRVEAGATLNLFDHPVVLSTFTGAGRVINGGVTVTNAVRASCAELFDGKHATFANSLTFAPGATFTITDPENLEAYAKRGSVTAFAAQTVNGTPKLAFEGEAAPEQWRFFAKGNGAYSFGAQIGTMLLLK